MLIHEIFIPLYVIVRIIAAVSDAKCSSEYHGAAIPPVRPGVHEPSVSRWELRPVGSQCAGFSQYHTKTTLTRELIYFCVILLY